MSTILRNRARKSVIAVGLALFVLQASALAATKVAVIDRNGGGGLDWVTFLTDNGYECTLFPATGPTSSLAPYQIIVDLSNVWADPDDLLADQMRAGKGVVTWKDAPSALQILSKPIVRAWIGANGLTGGSDRLLTTVMDPILGSRPPGTEIADSGDAGGSAVGGTEGHPDAKVLARWQNGNFVGLLRNTWEGGQSVYLTNYLHPGSQPDIMLNIFSVLSNPIPTTTSWGLVTFTIALLIVGSLALKRRR